MPKRMTPMPSSMKTRLLSATALRGASPIERRMGRLMRSEDGHGDGGAGDGAGAAADSAAATEPLDAGGTALGGDGGAGDAAGGGDATALGGEAEAGAIVEKTAEEIAAAEEAAAEAAKGAVPETYALTAPEGMTLDPKDIEAASPVFKELGLSNDQANKLMPVAAAFAQRIQDQANQQILASVAADRKAWLDTAKADPEIGGAKWGETIGVAASALDQLGFVKGSPFRVLLDESGLGNHPDMIRAFHKVGKAIGEDGVIIGDGKPGARKRDTAEILYENDQPKGGQ